MAVIVHLDRHDVTLCGLSQKLINKLKISYRPKVITKNGFFGCLPKKLRKKIWLYTFEPEFPFHGSIFDPIPAFTFDKSACNILYANHFISKDVTNTLNKAMKEACALMKEKSDYLLSLMKHKAYDFPNGVTVYHSQPGGISKEDLLNMLPCLFSPEELEAERKKLAEEKFEEDLLKVFKQAFCV